MSCAVPGMKRSSFGSSRSIFIWPLPLAADPPGLGLPRSFFSNPAIPLASPAMLNLPSRVSRMISGADRAQTKASH